MIQLSRIGHALIVVADLERSKRFYTQVLGFRVIEEDPEHGGVFLSLAHGTHVIDLVASPAPPAAGAAAERSPAAIGVQHLGFLVDTEAQLRDAWFTLTDAGVELIGAMDHGNQQSLYFYDPDQTMLEIYWERPGAAEMFARGREDRDDRPLVFER